MVPVTAALFLVATLSSIGLPGLNGFVGEFLILLGTWSGPARWWAVVAATGMILSAIYMLTLVQRVFWNPVTHDENRNMREIRPSEFLAAATLVILMLLRAAFGSLRVDEDAEEVGLDLSEHSEAAYLSVGTGFGGGTLVERPPQVAGSHSLGSARST